jgi:hypothetical protein
LGLGPDRPANPPAAGTAGPALDDTPATPEWLRSVGFRRGHVAGNWVAADDDWPIGCFWGYAADGYTREVSLWCRGRLVRANPTRQQVRALFRGLALKMPNGSEP